MEAGEASDRQDGRRTGEEARKRRQGDGGRRAPTAAAPRQSWKIPPSHGRCLQRVLLLAGSPSSRTPLDAAGAAAPTYGKTPKALRRWRLAALLMTRLDRVGRGRLQVCVQGGVVGDADGQQREERTSRARPSRGRAAPRATRWAKIFGNDAHRLEVCAGAGEGLAARAHPDVNCRV